MKIPPSRNSKIGTWYRMDGAWHLIRDINQDTVPGGLIIDKTWERNARMRDFNWELELWKFRSDGSGYFLANLGTFDYLKQAMEFADELFSAFL